MEESYEIVVPTGETGKRIDKFLSGQPLNVSRTQLKKSFDLGFVILNGIPARPKNAIHGGEHISIKIIRPREVEVRPLPFPLEILFEDKDIIVVNKPAGIVVHPGNGTPDLTLVAAVLAHCKLSAMGGKLRPGVVHRLDKCTSGVIIFAKSDEAYLNLIRMFAARRIEKIYQTVVCGVPTKMFGEISLPIGRNVVARTKMSTNFKGKEAITRWSVMRIFGTKFSQLKVNILTGRTHQIRVHMASMGFPVIGDIAYGYNKNYFPSIIAPRVLLHASQINFQHPCIAKEMTITAPLPADFSETLKSLAESF